MGDFLAGLTGGPGMGTTGPELKIIDIALLRADEKNFYAVTEDSVAELSANIELVGLQQPLNVRPNGEAGYIVISGHRRLAALKLLVSEGKESFSQVPCMVVEGGSDALNELRLIYGNANTRQLSNWELSKQAERVQELFYQLKEEGVEFPGRMRDHVAAACQVSKSKLSRLKVIREQLEIFVERWQGGTLSEALAYELAQCPVELQWRIRDLKLKPEKLQADKVKRVREEWERGARWEMENICTVSGKTCGHGDVALRRDLNAASWACLCKGEECCIKCRYGVDCKSYSSPCDRLCKIAADKKAAAKAAAEAAEAAKAEKELTKALAEFVAVIRPYVQAMEAAGVDQIKLGYNSYTLQKLKEWSDSPEACSNRWPLTSPSARDIAKVADQLGCSVDFLLGRTDNPSVGSADSSLCTREPQWQDGEPEKAGRCWCKIDFCDGLEPWTEDLRWNGERWLSLTDGAIVVAWWPLPEE